jgi:hypothetical protein
MPTLRPRSLTKAILTDPQLWFPVGILIFGIAVLVLVDRI